VIGKPPLGEGGMSDPLFDPMPIRYLGLYADEHFVDAQQFGKSIAGVSKVANSICHSLFFSEVTHDPRSYRIRFFVGPSKENGFLQELFAIANSGQLPLFSPFALKIAKPFIETMFDVLIKKIVGKKSEAEAVLSVLREIALRDHDHTERLIEGTLQNQQFLQTMVEKLASENRAPLREVAEPVGRTVRVMQIGNISEALPIDEAAAEVLRSREQLTVGNSDKYKVKLEGVFKTNGACRVRIISEDKIVSGKITDPSVAIPDNVYTRALNDGAELLVTAKPTLKDGKIKRLFISDGRLP